MSVRIVKNGVEYIVADASDNSGGSSVEVIDNRSSTSTTAALSANQGRVLNNLIQALNNVTGSLSNLNTQDKTNLVNAINELLTKIGQVPTNVYTKTEVDDLISGVESDVATDLLNYYTKTEVDSTVADLENMISAIPKFKIEVVNSLPTTNISPTTVYLVPSSNPDTGNMYNEYIYVNNNWEMIGSQRVDLSNYYTIAEINSLLAYKISSSDQTVLDIVSLTQSEYDTLKLGGDLVNGTIYNITDGNGDHVDINVIDNVNSTSGQDALSAKQGKILNDKLTGLIQGTCPVYDENSIYTLGMFCYNTADNTVYRCKYLGIVTGTFDATKWQAVNLSEIINGMTNRFYEAYTQVSSGVTYYAITYMGQLYDEVPDPDILINVKFPTSSDMGDAYLSLTGSALFKYPITDTSGTPFSITNVSGEYLTLLFDSTNERFYIYTGIGLVSSIDTIN